MSEYSIIFQTIRKNVTSRHNTEIAVVVVVKSMFCSTLEKMPEIVNDPKNTLVSKDKHASARLRNIKVVWC